MTKPQHLRALVVFVLGLLLPVMASAQEPPIPGWLQTHIGARDGQIARVVLERARAHYHAKRRNGEIGNPCYLAMDATRPSTTRSGEPGRRFYIICEAQQSFRAISSGYGNGRNLPRADFSNGRYCAKHFGNAEGSNLTTGGAYVTAETRTSFKGYIRQRGTTRAFNRPFLVFEGQGDTANARLRAIGGHQAAFVRRQCRLKRPSSPHADAQGYVPFGRLIDYTSGRSNGCTTWSEAGTRRVLDIVRDDPTTLYIYPEARDIHAVAQAVKARRSLSDAGTYWNATCLSEISAPQFWSKRKLQPIINAWRQSLTPSPRRELPVCK